MEPINKGFNFPIGPHPCGPSIELFKYRDRTVMAVFIMFDIAVYTVKIGPVALNGNEIKPVFLN
jgi:hypothetical protein